LADKVSIGAQSGTQSEVINLTEGFHSWEELYLSLELMEYLLGRRFQRSSDEEIDGIRQGTKVISALRQGNNSTGISGSDNKSKKSLYKMYHFVDSLAKNGRNLAFAKG
jgi:hypothetical protein